MSLEPNEAESRNQNVLSIYIYIYLYIYTYIYSNAWALPRPCSVEGPIPNQMLLQLCIPLGRSTKVLGNIKIPPPLNFTFNWEDQQRH